MGRSGFARLSNKLWTDDRVMRLFLDDPQAFGMWILSISYCSDLRTDGELTPLALRRLMCTRKVEDTLVAHGFWERKRGGKHGSIWVHSYLQWQNSRDQIDHANTLHAERQKRYRSRENTTLGGDSEKDVTRHMTSHVLPPKPKHKTKTQNINSSSYSSPRVTMTSSWQPSARALADSARWQGLDTEVALAAFSLHWIGVTKTQAEWDRLFQGWILNRAKKAHLTRKPPHRHTWLCSHTLQAAGISRDDASSHTRLLEYVAAGLNKGYPPREAVSKAQQACREKVENE